MKENIEKYVASRGVCPQAKAERVKYPGLLQPFEVLPGAWHTVTMDFIQGLPKSGAFSCILVESTSLANMRTSCP